MFKVQFEMEMKYRLILMERDLRWNGKKLNIVNIYIDKILYTQYIFNPDHFVVCSYLLGLIVEVNGKLKMKQQKINMNLFQFLSKSIFSCYEKQIIF